MIRWPDNLPCPQFGIEFKPRDPQLRTQMQSGRTISRRNFTAVPVDFSARWILTDAQSVRFEQFYQHDTQDGAQWFDMDLMLPQGLIERTVRFSGVYSFSRLGSCAWEYSCDMEMYLRAGD